MKNTILIFLFLISISGFSQKERPLKEKREQLKSMKIAYITEELKLTTDEAAKFWPLYNSFEESQKQIRQEKIKRQIDRIGNSNLSEKEAAIILQQFENNEEELHNLRKKFINNLKLILPATKIIKLKRAEDDFNKNLLKQFRRER